MVADRGSELQSDLFSSAVAIDSVFSPGRRIPGPWSVTVDVSTLSEGTEGTIRDSYRNDHVHALSGFAPCGIEGVDVEG